MPHLVTKCRYLKKLSTAKDCEVFLQRAKSTKSLDLIAENVLRTNNVKVDLTNWETARNSAQEQDLPEIVQIFIHAAGNRWLKLATQ
ncbi:hypothetical protein CZP2022_239 [Vibrio phage C-ZP2022]|nr:hypothetical protein CZP2022_239 [Vibrio phage C-ZP2022]